MRLATFIDKHREAILRESVAYASSLDAFANLKDAEAVLRDHLPLVLEAISRDLEQPQGRAASISKSQGHAPAAVGESAAQTHGQLRARSGLSIDEVVAEFRVLRSCVLRLWAEQDAPGKDTLQDVMRFNEAIDQAVAESVAFHGVEMKRWRELFLGVLGHDLRGPLNALILTSEVLLHDAQGTPVSEHARMLLRSGQRMSDLLDSLLDYNKAELGVGMTVRRKFVDLERACRDELDLLRVSLPDASIKLEVSGDTSGMFDAARVREAFANLLFNAAQYRVGASPIRATLRGDPRQVVIEVENEAGPIAPEAVQGFFHPLRRGSEESGSAERRNLGLGLFIVREISRAHGGESKASMKGSTITFTMVLPKK